jgi:hypothetical protein
LNVLNSDLAAAAECCHSDYVVLIQLYKTFLLNLAITRRMVCETPRTALAQRGRSIHYRVITNGDTV